MKTFKPSAVIHEELMDIDRDNEVYRPLYEEIVSKWSKELKL